MNHTLDLEGHVHLHLELCLIMVEYCAQVLTPLIDLIKNDVLTNANTTQFVRDSANNLVLPVRS